MTIVISVENLSKAYRLGQIGTGTFTNDLKLWWAKIRGKPNPLLRISEADCGNRDGNGIRMLREVSSGELRSKVYALFYPVTSYENK